LHSSNCPRIYLHSNTTSCLFHYISLGKNFLNRSSHLSILILPFHDTSHYEKSLYNSPHSTVSSSLFPASSLLYILLHTKNYLVTINIRFCDIYYYTKNLCIPLQYCISSLHIHSSLHCSI